MNVYTNIHKMKINFTYMFLVFILVLLVVISMTRSCVSVKPYDESTIFSQDYPYEGMTPGMTPSTDTKDNMMDTIMSDIEQSVKGKKASSPSPSPSQSPSDPSVPTEAFTSLLSSDYGKEEKLDIFSGTRGSLECSAKSFNLTNSKGGLCLDEKQTRMLLTRGGNATGGGF